jgi:serine/threonine protein kinase
MGHVYRARDTRLERAVALKLLPEEFRDRSDRQRRFQSEARLISSLNHPHICALFDVGEQDGISFLVMEYLDGETLEDRLTRGPLPASEVLRYAAQIADALDHAHQSHITHRDLKPSNVMLTATGVKLLDFGLARGPALQASGVSTQSLTSPGRVTTEGTLVGTCQYMAPEQLEGTETDRRNRSLRVRRAVVRDGDGAEGVCRYEPGQSDRVDSDEPSPGDLVGAIRIWRRRAAVSDRSHRRPMPCEEP